MTIKISVTGIRGKSSYTRWMELILRNRGFKTLAKVTGEHPFWIHNGEIIPIKRKNKLVFLTETLEYKKYQCDVFIAENQGIRPYTMRIFNDIVNPDIVIITNIRLDHTDTMGNTYEKIAQSIGHCLNKTKIVISGDDKYYINNILKNLSLNAKFIRSNAVRINLENYTPLNPIIKLVNTTLIAMKLTGLTYEEIKLIDMDIQEQMKLHLRNDNRGYIFHGAKLNDVDSTSEVLQYLLNKYPNQIVNVVAYLRADRAERTRTFIDFFKEISKISNINQIILLGYGAKYVSDNAYSKVISLNDNTSITNVMNMCDDSIIFTCCNGVNPFMESFKKYTAIK